MMAASKKTPLERFCNNGVAIPDLLKSAKRWAPWRASWNVAREKYDKLPKDARNPERGISTASPDSWYSFADALASHQGSQGGTNGVGYVMTKVHGVIGVDIDGAVDRDTKVVDQWALDVVRALNSYTEISPSGRGLRVFVSGALPDGDWVNHQVGIEVYSGGAPRFLTVTGRTLVGYSDADGVVLEAFPAQVNAAPAAVIAQLAGQYRQSAAQKAANGEAPPMPALLDVDDLPALDTLDLPPRAAAFLTDGESSGDRSLTLWSTTISLYGAGLTDLQVQSTLVSNHHALEVALNHRGQDADKAAMYLWKHMTCKAREIGVSKALCAEDFEQLEAEYEATELDIPEQIDPAQVVAGDDDFENLGPDLTAAKPKAKAAMKFAPIQAAAYAGAFTRMDWLVPNVIPAKSFTSVFGESGSGKTFWVLDVAMRMACGMPWWGKTLARRRVVYVAAEGAQGVKLRLNAWAKHNAVSLDDADFFVIAGQPNLLENEDVKLLVQAIRSIGPIDLLILDTIAQVTPGANENSSEDMGKAIKHCNTLISVLKTTVMLVAHSGKDIARGQRGWSGLKGAMDSQIEVIRSPTFRSATVSKLKDGSGEGDEYIFKLATVDLDWDIEEGDITSCVVEPEMDADQKAAHKNAQQEAQKKPPGRRKDPSGGKWGWTVIRALETLCGWANTPVKREVLEPAALALVASSPDAAKDAKSQHLAVTRALKALIEARRDVLYDEDNNLFTLRVPPAPVSFDD
jgi:KaiC/GvpD/RAD55 family RecA-like ATPase